MTTKNLSHLAPAFATAANELLAAILDQSADCIKVISSDGTVDYMNRNGQCVMEIDDFCTVAGQSWTSLWPAEAKVQIERAMNEARSGRLSRIEAYCPTAKGSPRWWEVSVSPLRRPDGVLDGFIATSRDVTARVNYAALRDTMADEMRHRLRNNYAIVGGLLNTHARGNPHHEQFASDMIHRLVSLGIAQTMRADGDTSLLNELVSTVLGSYATPGCPINVGTIPRVLLDQSQADSLALVLGELAVNSMKHGALSARGEVSVEGSLAGGEIRLAWLESSDRPVEKHHREGGQGLRLLSRVLASRSGGIKFAWGDLGLKVSIRLAT